MGRSRRAAQSRTREQRGKRARGPRGSLEAAPEGLNSCRAKSLPSRSIKREEIAGGLKELGTLVLGVTQTKLETILEADVLRNALDNLRHRLRVVNEDRFLGTVVKKILKDAVLLLVDDNVLGSNERALRRGTSQNGKAGD